MMIRADGLAYVQLMSAHSLPADLLECIRGLTRSIKLAAANPSDFAERGSPDSRVPRTPGVDKGEQTPTLLTFSRQLLLTIEQ